MARVIIAQNRPTAVLLHGSRHWPQCPRRGGQCRPARPGVAVTRRGETRRRPRGTGHTFLRAERHPQATFRADGGLLVIAPYTPGLVARLKAAVPAASRRYEPLTQAWVIAPPHAAVALRALLALYPDAVVGGGPCP